jgi:hypothetical protein
MLGGSLLMEAYNAAAQPDETVSPPPLTTPTLPADPTAAGPIEADPIEDLCGRLQKSQLQSSAPEQFERDLADAFSALGFEALSRGAGRCTFIDIDRRTLDAVRHSARELEVEARSEFVCAPAGKALVGKGPFDLVFFDPRNNRNAFHFDVCASDRVRRPRNDFVILVICQAIQTTVLSYKPNDTVRLLLIAYLYDFAF